MLHFHIITLFPESIKPYLDASMLGRAQRKIEKHGSKPGRKAVIEISYYNPRDFTADVNGRVDRRPYGGGPGMVIEPEAVLKAAAQALGKNVGKKTNDAAVLFFSPSGKQFDAQMACELAQKKHIMMIAGHYEGVDARAPQILKATPISVGPYVLTGGELPAATVIDAVARHVPGVLGAADSIEEDRVASPDVYTRPEVLVWKKKKYSVPKVLLSGNPKLIDAWKKENGA